MLNPSLTCTMPRLSGNLRLSHVKYFLPSVCSMSSHMMSIGMSCSSNLAETVTTSFWSL